MLWLDIAVKTARSFNTDRRSFTDIKTWYPWHGNWQLRRSSSVRH